MTATAPRILVCTGAGGAGTTTVAAATARRLAGSGSRVALCGVDGSPALADVLGAPVGGAPTPVAPGLDAVQLDARGRLEASWGDARDQVATLLGWIGGTAPETDELALVPGFDEAFALAQIDELSTAGDHDVVVVDAGPWGPAGRLLSLPAVLGWYVERLLPPRDGRAGRGTAAVRPLLARIARSPLAPDDVVASLTRLAATLRGSRDRLTDPAVTSVRLVAAAEPRAVSATRRTRGVLSLFGLHVDAVVVNRLLPAAVTDPWFRPRRESQARCVAELADVCAPVPVLRAELAADAVAGPASLDAFGAALWAGYDPATVLTPAEPLRVEVGAGGDGLVVSIPLPGTARDDVQVGRSDDALVVTVGAHRHHVALPASARDGVVAGARLDAGRLDVVFAPNTGARAAEPGSPLDPARPHAPVEV